MREGAPGLRGQGAILIHRVAAIVASATLFWTVLAFAAPALADITNGINWLATQSNPNGSFGNTPTSLATPLQSTAEVLRVYQALNQSSQPTYLPAQAYLNADAENNTEFLSRKIIVNASAGNDTSVLLAELLTHQNSDGGYGDRAGYNSSVSDTALACLVTASRLPISDPRRNGAITYLIGMLDTDGGITGQSDPERIALNASALLALGTSNEARALTAASRVMQWLQAKQQADGSWAGDVYLTALTTIAAVSKVGGAPTVVQARAFLTQSQRADGSWDGDPFTTALALRALSPVDVPPGGGGSPGPTTGTVTARFSDAQSGAPAAGVQLTLQNGAVQFQSASDASGAVRLTDLAPGSYNATAALSGYGMLQTTVGVRAGETTDLGTLSITRNPPPGATVRGTITDATSGIGILGATVTVVVNGQTFTAVTSDTGEYVIGSLPLGTAQLTATRAGSYRAATGTATFIGGGIYSFSPRLELISSGTAASLQGAISNGSNGSAIAGATVRLSGASQATTTTDANGNFRLTGLSSGSVTVTVSAAGFNSVSGSLTLATSTTIVLNATLSPTAPPAGATVRGIVSDATSGIGLPGATIAVTVNGQTFIATTNDTGDYILSALPIGAAEITVSHPGSYRPASSTVTFAAGSTYIFSPRLEPISSGTTASLQGTITNASGGAVIAGAMVRLSGAAQDSATTDGNGNYRLTGLSAGSVTVTISASGFHSISSSFNLTPSTTTVLNVGLTASTGAPGTLRLRIVNGKTLAPISGANVQLTHDGIFEDRISDSAGEIPAISYTSGELGIRASQPGFQTAEYVTFPYDSSLGGGNLGDFPLLPDHISDAFPELLATRIDRAGVLQSPTLEVSGQLLLSIRNDGRQPTPNGFAVLTFVDRNHNGIYDPGIDPMLGQARVNTSLAAAASTDVTIPVSGSLLFRDEPMSVWLDSDSQVLQRDDLNRVTSTAAFCTRGSLPALAPSQTLPAGMAFGADFAPFYRVDFLGPVPNVTLRYGFMITKRDDFNTLLVGGAANGPTGTMNAVRVQRDVNGHILGYVGNASVVASAPYNDGGAVYAGPDGVLLLTQWPVNRLGQLKPTDTAPGKTIDTAALGVASSISAINQVPAGFAGAGSIKMVTYGGGSWYSATLQPDANGYFDLVGVQPKPASQLGGGPEGFVYIKNGTPGFAKDSLLISAYAANEIHAYEIDSNGDPIPSTKRVFLSGVAGAEGAMIDPVTGDYLFSTFGGLNQTLAIRGFFKPQPLSDLTASLAKVTLDASGRVATITVRVGNAGPETSPLVRLSYFALRNSQRGELLGQVVIDPLASGTYRDQTLTLANPVSLTAIQVYADFEQTVIECSKGNNSVDLPLEPFLVGLTVNTDKMTYAVGDVAQLTADVQNFSSSPKDLTLRLTIQDRAGGIVQTFPNQTVTQLAPSDHRLLSQAWPVGTLLAGHYQLVGELLSADGAVIATAVASFTMGASAVTVATRVTLDKSIYDAWDSVTIIGRVQNVAPNVILAPSRVEVTVRSPVGQILLFESRALGQLLPGGVRDAPFTLRLSDAAVGGYAVDLVLKDEFTRAVLSTANTSFQVRRREVQAITGSVSVQSARVYIGDGNGCTETAKNVSATTLNNVKLIHQLINVSGGLVFDEYIETVSLPAGGLVYNYFRNVNTGSIGLGDFSCVIKAEIGGETKTLAFGGFQVVQPPIRIDAEMKIGARGKLLILLDRAHESCRDEDDGDHDEHDNDADNRSGNRCQHGANDDRDCTAGQDPHGPKTAPDLAAQRQFLEQLLTNAGWTYTIVDTGASFAKELKSGAYVAYGLFSEHVKLSQTTQKALREAIFRGEGLLLAGSHDNRNQKLNEILGLKRIGTLSHATRVVIPTGILGVEGTADLLAGDRINRIKRLTAQTLATYELSAYGSDTRCDDEDDDQETDECDGHHPDTYIDAITFNTYGSGKAIFAGFDLLAQATKEGSSGISARTLLGALSASHPTPIAPSLGRVLPIDLKLTNRGIATTATVTIAIPTGTAVDNAGGGTVTTASTGATLTYTVNLGVGEEKTLRFNLKLPNTEAALNLHASITAGNRLITETDLTITVPAISTIDDLVQQAQTLASQYPAHRHKLNAAQNDLDKAAKARTLDKAIDYALKATDDLLGITEPDVVSFRQRIDSWLRYMLMLVG